MSPSRNAAVPDDFRRNPRIGRGILRGNAQSNAVGCDEGRAHPSGGTTPLGRTAGRRTDPPAVKKTRSRGCRPCSRIRSRLINGSSRHESNCLSKPQRCPVEECRRCSVSVRAGRALTATVQSVLEEGPRQRPMYTIDGVPPGCRCNPEGSRFLGEYQPGTV